MFNIARNIYAGWDPASNKELPEAEIIPIGETSNEKKRLERITKKYTNLHEHENLPLPGFTLLCNDRKTWGALDTTWLVIDPRGFLVRITNENLQSILHTTGITEGLIQEKCVWGREDNQTKMSLVPISSPLYTEAVKNTELIEGKVSISDVQIGDKVLLQNELEGIYMGVLNLYGPVTNNYRNEGLKAKSNLRKQVLKVGTGRYFYRTDLKVLKVLEKTDNPLTREESAKLMNEEIARGNSFITSQDYNISSGKYYGSYDIISFVSTSAVATPVLTFEEVDALEAAKIFYDAQATCDAGMLLLEEANKTYLVDFPYIAGASSPTSTHFSVLRVENPADAVEHLTLMESKRSYYTKQNTPTYSLHQFSKYYRIVKNVKKEKYI